MNLLRTYAKTTLLAFIVCFSITSLSAQSNKSSKAKFSTYGPIETSWYRLGWFVDGNLGIRMFGATSEAADLGLGLSGNAGLGYLFSDAFGLKGRIDYNRYTFTPGIGGEVEARGTAVSVSFEAFTEIIALTTKSRQLSDWRILLHGGIGYTTFANKSFKDDRLEQDPDYFQDPYIKGNDDMANIIVGVTPQYHISGRWSVNLDISSFFLIKQDFTLDNYNGERFNGIGNITNASIGLTFRP